MLLNKNEKDKGWWVGWNIDKDSLPSVSASAYAGR